MTVRTMQAPARMTSARLGWSPTIGPALLRARRPVLLDLAVDLRSLQHRALDTVRVVRGEPELDRGEVGDRAAHADERVDRGAAVEPREVGRDRGEGVGEDLGSDRVVQPEALRVADRADVHAEALVDGAS